MNATDVMVGIPHATDFELDDSAGLDTRDVALHQQWHLLGIAPGEPVELRTLGTIYVAYPRSLQSAIALAREADTFEDITGAYVVASRITPALAKRYPADRWVRAYQGSAGAEDTTHRRVLYFDCDAERPKATETNATDEQKACAVRLADRLERWLCSKLDPRCIGRLDSGNGVALFGAIEPEPCSDATDDRIAEFLRRLAAAFVEPGAKLDISVHNRDRLVPLAGSMKRKGPHSPERPWRRTYCACRAPVVRVPLSEIL